MFPEIKKNSKGFYVKLWQVFLTNQGYELGTPDGDFGKNTDAATKKFQSESDLNASGIVDKDTFDAAAARGFKVPESKGISFDQLRGIMKGAKATDIENFLEPLKRVMEKYEINTPLRMVHFLAQIAHESGSLRFKQEIASGAAYEGRKDLGNTRPGDGKKFKGHGLIQITGRANHTAYAEYVGDPDLIEHPERIGTEPDHSAGAAGWFWMKKNLNAYADKDDILTITKRINGGTNGLQDRKNYLAAGKKVFGI